MQKLSAKLSKRDPHGTSEKEGPEATASFASPNVHQSVVVLVSVQGVQNGAPHFQFTHFEGVPNFSLRAFKNL